MKEPGIRLVSSFECWNIVFCKVAKTSHDLRIIDHDKSSYSRNDHDQRDDEFEQGGHQYAFLGFLKGFCCERTLNNVLVEAPVIEVGYPHPSYQNANTRQVHILGVRLVQDHHKFIGNTFVYNLQPFEKPLTSRNLIQGQVCRCQATEHQEHNLNDVGPGNCRQSAIQRIGRGKQGKTEHPVD